MDIERTIEIGAPAEGVWHALIRLLYGRLARRYVQTEAESLERRCEARR